MVNRYGSSYRRISHRGGNTSCCITTLHTYHTSVVVVLQMVVAITIIIIIFTVSFVTNENNNNQKKKNHNHITFIHGFLSTIPKTKTRIRPWQQQQQQEQFVSEVFIQQQQQQQPYFQPYQSIFQPRTTIRSTTATHFKIRNTENGIKFWNRGSSSSRSTTSLDSFFRSRYSESFGASNSSSHKNQTMTIPSPQEAAERVGVRPTAPNLPSVLWKFLYHTHIRILPILHIMDRYNVITIQQQHQQQQHQLEHGINDTNDSFYNNNQNQIQNQKNRDSSNNTTTAQRVLWPILAVNNHLSLWVLWNKALSAGDPTSPVYETSFFGNSMDGIDNEFTYDMLPSISRYILLKFIPNFLYPRLYHANIEIRTAYLNKIIENDIHTNYDQMNNNNNNNNTNNMNRNNNNNKKIRLVILGAGYDVRATRLLNTMVDNKNNISNHKKNGHYMIDEAWEVDVPEVITAKQYMLQRLCYRRQQKRKKKQQQQQQQQNKYKDDMTQPLVTTTTTTTRIPHLRSVDLNNSTALQNVLQEIVHYHDDDDDDNNQASSLWHTIFVSEAVFIYLNQTVPSRILQQCYDSINDMNSHHHHDNLHHRPNHTASFCFADRLENCPGGDYEPARQTFVNTGWELMDWFPRPGLARHMGYAEIMDQKENKI